MKEIRIRSLSRAQRRELQRQKSIGDLAEEIVAEQYGLSTFNNAEWYDCHDDSTGTKYEVKSTASQIGDKFPGNGRFRLWENQHRSLAASEGQNMAWYAFVLLDESDGEIRIQRRRPTTVTSIINDRGGWNTAGHAGRSDRQHKLPYPEVF